jgi:hypothetical protein
MAKLKYDETLCPACAEVIKAAASKCKHCGHQITKEDIKRRLTNSEVKARGELVGGCIVLVLLALALSMCVFGGDKEDPDEAARVAATEAAEEAVDREKGFHCLSGWDGSSRELVAMVKDRLRDPDSFEHDETRVAPNVGGQHVIIMRYRARNGFGGMNVSYAKAAMSNATCSITNLEIGE